MFHRIYKEMHSIWSCSCRNYNEPHSTEPPSRLSDSKLDHFALDIDDLSNITYSNTIPFIPPITRGKVIKVYDGDTITIAAKLPYPESPIYRISVRLNGIDTPEIKGHTQKEKDLAKHVRDILHAKLMYKIVELQNTNTEKYGRLLADVYLDGICINDWMIQQGFAVSYDGGTKNRPEHWA